MQFLEIKETLGGVRKEFACALVRRDPRQVVLRYVLDRSARVAGVDLPPGTVTLAYYWADRPYNVYHWVRPDGTTAAWYFNLSADLRISDHSLTWRDLTVDILVVPGRDPVVLDEDELPPDLSPEIRAQVDEACRAALRDAPDVIATVESESRALLASS
ncbi:MAG: DUF402 domain-containing protein [Armatimonadetes bacterium]|nr:DUF402 domain-containing protein [Armatimonadota bacterium]